MHKILDYLVLLCLTDGNTEVEEDQTHSGPPPSPAPPSSSQVLPECFEEPLGCVSEREGSWIGLGWAGLGHSEGSTGWLRAGRRLSGGACRGTVRF